MTLDPPRLRHWNIWSHVEGAVWGGLGEAALLGAVGHRGQVTLWPPQCKSVHNHTHHINKQTNERTNECNIEKESSKSKMRKMQTDLPGIQVLCKPHDWSSAAISCGVGGGGV